MAHPAPQRDSAAHSERRSAMTSHDFPCFACGFTGPHVVMTPERPPEMPDTVWAEAPRRPPLTLCGACHRMIWEPDTGDGVDVPNLTLIPPGLRALAHQALEARDARGFLILAERHYRYQLAGDNAFYLRRRGLWESVLLAQLYLEQPD